MKKQVVSWLIIIGLIVLMTVVYIYGRRPATPTVGADGKISGHYTITGIQRLDQPYVCTFEKTDEVSKIVGVIHLDKNNVYGEFRIKTDLVEKEFNSFLVVNNKEAYVWTSLNNVGYKSPAAKSANKNASPLEQAQIVGFNDKIPYECKPWLEIDSTIFEIPSWIVFSEL